MLYLLAVGENSVWPFWEAYLTPRQTVNKVVAEPSFGFSSSSTPHSRVTTHRELNLCSGTESPHLPQGSSGGLRDAVCVNLALASHQNDRSNLGSVPSLSCCSITWLIYFLQRICPFHVTSFIHSHGTAFLPTPYYTFILSLWDPQCLEQSRSSFNPGWMNEWVNEDTWNTIKGKKRSQESDSLSDLRIKYQLMCFFVFLKRDFSSALDNMVKTTDRVSEYKTKPKYLQVCTALCILPNAKAFHYSLKPTYKNLPCGQKSQVLSAFSQA